RMKALEAALAVHRLVVFPNSTAEQREKGMTEFNDLALESARLAKRQLEEAVWRARQQGQEQTGEMWNAQSHQIWQKSRQVAFNLASDKGRARHIGRGSV